MTESNILINQNFYNRSMTQVLTKKSNNNAFLEKNSLDNYDLKLIIRILLIISASLFLIANIIIEFKFQKLIILIILLMYPIFYYNNKTILVNKELSKKTIIFSFILLISFISLIIITSINKISFYFDYKLLTGILYMSILEEFYHRDYFYKMFNSIMSVKSALLLQALIFSLSHVFIYSKFYQFIIAFYFGIILGLISNISIELCILSHISINLIIYMTGATI